MAIADKLTELQATKTAIKTAIEAKNQDLTNVPFTQYAEKITAIESGSGGVDTSGKVSAAIATMTVVDISPADIDYLGVEALSNAIKVRATQAHAYFLGCNSLKTFISDKSQQMQVADYCFQDCTSLEEVKIYNLNGTYNTAIFNRCSALEKITIYNPGRWAFTSGHALFGNLSNIKVIDLSGYTDPVAPSLRDGAFVGTDLSARDPADYCKIIIPDGLYKTWVAATNWAALPARGFTFVKASEYTE